MPEQTQPTKECPQCQSDIAPQAQKCPHCQSDLRNWFARHKVLTGVVVTIFVLMVFGAVAGEPPDPSEAPTKTESVTESAEEELEVLVVFDVASFVGKDAWEIKDIATNHYGEPDVYREPQGERFGTLNWTNRDHRLMFGFDFYADGSIAEALIVTGAVEDGWTVETVLAAANLQRQTQDYETQVNPLGETETINIWVIPSDGAKVVTDRDETAPPESVAEQSYHPVMTFRGDGAKKSEPFTTTGDRFRIRYDCQGDLCQAFLYQVGRQLPEGLIVNTTGPVSDETIFYGAGEYYIDSNSLGSYEMVVEDYR